MTPIHLLAFAIDLINECMKLKAYGYFGHKIDKVYNWLMIGTNRAISFSAKDEELKKLWVEEFFESVHMQAVCYSILLEQ